MCTFKRRKSAKSFILSLKGTHFRNQAFFPTCLLMDLYVFPVFLSSDNEGERKRV